MLRAEQKAREALDREEAQLASQARLEAAGRAKSPLRLIARPTQKKRPLPPRDRHLRWRRLGRRMRPAPPWRGADEPRGHGAGLPGRRGRQAAASLEALDRCGGDLRRRIYESLTLTVDLPTAPRARVAARAGEALHVVGAPSQRRRGNQLVDDRLLRGHHRRLGPLVRVCHAREVAAGDPTGATSMHSLLKRCLAVVPPVALTVSVILRYLAFRLITGVWPPLQV